MLRKLPRIKIWTDEPADLGKHKLYKGKFVVTRSNKFFAKLFPEQEWNVSSFFHSMILEEMGIEHSDSPAVKKEIKGGGTIEVELIDDYVEVRLYGKSSIYGPYQPDCVDIGGIEAIIRTMFDLMDISILVIPDRGD